MLTVLSDFQNQELQLSRVSCAGPGAQGAEWERAWATSWGLDGHSVWPWGTGTEPWLLRGTASQSKHGLRLNLTSFGLILKMKQSWVKLRGSLSETGTQFKQRALINLVKNSPRHLPETSPRYCCTSEKLASLLS